MGALLLAGTKRANPLGIALPLTGAHASTQTRVK
jgi:hypothetical protein